MAKKQLKEYPDVTINPDGIKGKIDFSDVFGRKSKVHIEVGSGRGTFLVNQAKAFPEINFLGIEWARKYYKYTADRIGRLKIKNARIIRTEAASFIANSVNDGTVDCFHIYFPDPWPKTRHHRRRFASVENVSQMIRCLKKNGQINIATDHAEYFEWMKKVFENFTGKLKPIDFIRPSGAQDNEFVGTNYERKYIKEKRNIWTLAFRKLSK